MKFRRFYLPKRKFKDIAVHAGKKKQKQKLYPDWNAE